MGTVPFFESLRKSFHIPSIVVLDDLFQTAGRFEAESPVGCNDHRFTGGGIHSAPIGTIIDLEGSEVLDFHRTTRP